MKVAGIVSMAMLGLLMVAIATWGVLALAYAGPPNELLRNAIIIGFAGIAVVALIALLFRRWRWRAFSFYIACFCLLLLWWHGITPSNARAWQTDVAVLASAVVDGDIVTVHNIRNFDYRSETDYTPVYYDKHFDLRQLKGVDVVAVYWMGPAIAHVFLSFDFGGDNHLAISIETRKEKDEAYSTIKGFFRQYELYYVVADERDVIRLRTNYRRNPPEDVYVFRAVAPLENIRRLFLEYVNKFNALNTEPEFYNTLATNCTTSIWLNTRVNAQHLPLNWEVLVSGYLPRYLYEQGLLETYGLSFTELQRRAHINARALSEDTDTNFSQRIRDADVRPEK